MASSRELNFATNYEGGRMLEKKVYSPVHKSDGQRSTRQTSKLPYATTWKIS